MKNKNIKDIFDLFSLTEERKGKIYNSIVNIQSKDKRIGLHFKAKLAYSLLACFILVVVALILLRNPIFNSSRSLIEPDNTQYYQAVISSESTSMLAATDKKAMFTGFVLTAYAVKSEAKYLSANYMEESELMILTPGIKVKLAKYSPAMSSVPGLPFTVDITNDCKDNLCIEAINVSVDSGGLNKWNRETGVVSSEGQTTIIDSGETIYWSPIYNEDNGNAKTITIIIEAVTNDTVIGRQSIYITQDEPGYYYTTIGELELL